MPSPSRSARRFRPARSWTSPLRATSELIDQSSSIDAMRKLNPGYTLDHHSEGHLSEAGQGREGDRLRYPRRSCRASCRADEVYTMIKTIAANTKTLATVAKDIADADAEGMAEDIGVPFHPGAAKFYKEAGITVQSH